MKRIAIILSGCGFLDGAEIHESVLCLLALEQEGFKPYFFAPDIIQNTVVNHLTQKQVDKNRNILEESARIARGDINPLNTLNTNEYDALAFPGGFGAALSLSSYATKQVDCEVLEDITHIIKQAIEMKKPILATCISPVILGKVLQSMNLQASMTLGSSDDSIEQLNAFNMIGKSAKIDEIIIDDELKIVTTPCYMEPANLPAMFEGIKKAAKALLELS
jgi:enhancing lycopene biosynthesis protein 2